MRYARTLIPALEEAISRSVRLFPEGHSRRVGAGIYSDVPAGRGPRKIGGLVREELDRTTPLEPLLPAEDFKEPGRWEAAYGGALARLKDRQGGEHHLGPPDEAREARPIGPPDEAREARPRLKSNDADLLGIRLRVTVGDNALDAGGVELKPRRDAAKHGQIIALSGAAAKIHQLVQQARDASAASEAA